MTTPYRPDSERGIAWDDPDIAITWPLGQRQPSLSDRAGSIRGWPIAEILSRQVFRI